MNELLSLLKKNESSIVIRISKFVKLSIKTSCAKFQEEQVMKAFYKTAAGLHLKMPENLQSHYSWPLQCCMQFSVKLFHVVMRLSLWPFFCLLSPASQYFWRHHLFSNDTLNLLNFASVRFILVWDYQVSYPWTSAPLFPLFSILWKNTFILQVQQGSGQAKYAGPVDVVKSLYREGGIRSIYKGTVATLLRGKEQFSPHHFYKRFLMEAFHYCSRRTSVRCVA